MNLLFPIMENNIVEIVYFKDFGGFSVPKEILHYCGLSEESDCWDIRTNKKLVEIVKILKGKKDKDKDIPKILLEEFNIKVINDYRVFNLKSFDIAIIPEDAYNKCAIFYREYDGKETLGLDSNIYNTQIAREKLKNIILYSDDLSLKEKLTEIYNLLPIFQKPNLVW